MLVETAVKTETMTNPSSSLYGGVAMVRNVRSSPPAPRSLTQSMDPRNVVSSLSLRGSDLEERTWNVASGSSPPTARNLTVRPSQLSSPRTLQAVDLSLSPEGPDREIQFESEYLRSLFRNEKTPLSPESAAVLGLGNQLRSDKGNGKDGLEHSVKTSPIGFSVLSTEATPDSGTPPLRRVSSMQAGYSGSGERWRKGTARPVRPLVDGADKENVKPDEGSLQVQQTPFRPPLHPRTISREKILSEVTDGRPLQPNDCAPTPVNQKIITSSNSTVQRSSTTARWRRVGRLGLGPAKRSRPEDEPVQESEAEVMAQNDADGNEGHDGEQRQAIEVEVEDVEQGRRFAQPPRDLETEPQDAGENPSSRWRGLGVSSKVSTLGTQTTLEPAFAPAGHFRQASQEWTARPPPLLPNVAAVPQADLPGSRALHQLQSDLAYLNVGNTAPAAIAVPRQDLDQHTRPAAVAAAQPLSAAATQPLPPSYTAPVPAHEVVPAALPIPTQPPPPVPVPTKSSKGNVLVNGRAFTRLDVIGRGGSSKVYKVMAPNNRIFALKKVSFDKADQSAVAGYINEIGLLKRLSGNDRIIRLYDAEVSHEKGFLLMLMECGEIDLAHLLQKQAGKAINLNFIRMYWEQMLQAVHAIHEERIVHSDLKPANFLLVEGSLKLIDFGIAKAISNDTTNIHRDQQVGTVNYMSPEAINDTNVGMPGGAGKRLMKLGRPSDVWSLGCILYQMVFGRPPFAALSMYQKIQVIPDPNYKINFPATAKPMPPSNANGGGGAPSALTEDELERMAVDVEPDLLGTMKSCLERDGKRRMTIPELLQDPFLRPGKRADAARQDRLSLDAQAFAEVVGQVLAFAKARRHDMISKEDSEILSKTLYSRLKG